MRLSSTAMLLAFALSLLLEACAVRPTYWDDNHGSRSRDARQVESVVD